MPGRHPLQATGELDRGLGPQAPSPAIANVCFAPQAGWSKATELDQRTFRAEAADAPKRVYQEQEHFKRARTASGLEQSDNKRSHAVIL